MSRLPTPDEIRASVEAYFSVPVVVERRSNTGGRRYLARCVYWAALGAAGYNGTEVAELTGASRTTVYKGINAAPREYVNAVLANVVLSA